MIAALFVDEAGVYSTASNVDIWGPTKDARNYDGPHAVIAHPPCQLWGPFANVNFARYGGEHNRPGNDGGCFASALASVRRFRGVLEHPAFSRAWPAHDLKKPSGTGWSKANENEWVCEVWQSAYGHLARKRTWLLYVGDSWPKEMRWDRKPGTHQIGFHDQRGKEKNKPSISGKAASATPKEFMHDLIALVEGAHEMTAPRKRPQMSEINQRLWPVQAVVAYDKLKDELNEQEIALARIFSDAIARLTEERDKLFQDLLSAHPFYYREWEKAKAENAKLRAALGEIRYARCSWQLSQRIASEALK